MMTLKEFYSFVLGYGMGAIFMWGSPRLFAIGAMWLVVFGILYVVKGSLKDES